jgi:hypothetical protein
MAAMEIHHTSTFLSQGAQRVALLDSLYVSSQGLFPHSLTLPWSLDMRLASLLISKMRWKRERKLIGWRKNQALIVVSKHFHPCREPFAMTVAGETIYIATSANDIAGIWKNSRAFSMDPLSTDMYGRVGLSKESVNAMFDTHPHAQYNSKNPRPLTPTQMVAELHHQQLRNGPHLDALMKNKLLPSLFSRLDFSKPSHPALLSHSERSVVVSLLELCVDLFITEETKAYFGPALLKNSPDLVKHFMTWEYVNWKFIYLLPDIFAGDMLSSKSYMTTAFTNYYKLTRSERSDSVFFVTALEDMLREVGLSDRELGQFTLLHYWAYAISFSQLSSC